MPQKDTDIITGEILDDGTIRTVTDPISPANHSSANGLYKLMSELAGGGVEKQKRGKNHTHNQEHNQEHIQGGH